MKRIIELPCDIGDNIYEIILDKRSKEAYFEQYAIQDVSINAIKYCNEWKDRSEIGTRLFLDKEVAENLFEDMRASEKFKGYRFFYGDKEILN